MNCPRCGLPESWPNEPCEPIRPAVLKRMTLDYQAQREAGTEESWREWGAHTWSHGRKPS